MPKSLLDLAKDMKQLAAKLQSEASRAAVSAAQTILYDLAFVTPVDTSQALSNWQVSLKTPISTSKYLLPYYPGEHGTTQRDSALAAIEAGKAILAKKKPGVTIYISNVAPYIRKLNDGYSGQEPKGFVEQAALLGKDVLSKFKLKL